MFLSSCGLRFTITVFFKEWYLLNLMICALITKILSQLLYQTFLLTNSNWIRAERTCNSKTAQQQLQSKPKSHSKREVDIDNRSFWNHGLIGTEIMLQNVDFIFTRTFFAANVRFWCCSTAKASFHLIAFSGFRRIRINFLPLNKQEVLERRQLIYLVGRLRWEGRNWNMTAIN